MKLSKHLILRDLVPSVDWKHAFKDTQSGVTYKLLDIQKTLDFNIPCHTFHFKQVNVYPSQLETIEITNHFYGGVVVKLKFQDNLFSSSMHTRVLKGLYRSIMQMVLKHLAQKLIKELGLRECVVTGFISKHQFNILKPHKRIADDYIDSEPDTLYILKNGALMPYPLQKLGIGYNIGFLKMLRDAVLDELVKE